MITYLKAENFQKHERIEIEFTEAGMTLICGENWAGKTTILRAILYGLFGPSGIPGGAKAAQRRGCPTKPVVELGFKVDTDYRVRRTASVTRLFRDSKMAANGTRPVNDTIRELLGMDGQTFALLKYAPQEQAGAILTLGAEKLSKLINQITGVTLVEQVIEKAAHEGSVARSMQEQLEVVDPEPLRQQVQALVSELKARYAGTEGLKGNIENLHQKFGARSKEVQALVQRWEAKQKDIAKAATLRGSLQTLKGQLANQPQYGQVPDRDKLRKEVEELEDLHQAEVSRGTRQGEIDQQVAVLKERQLVAEGWLKTYGPTYLEGSPNDEQMEKYERQEKEAYERVRSAYEDAQRINKLARESVCPTCERPMEGVDLKSMNDRLAQAVQHNAKCSEAYQERSKQVALARQQREIAVECLQNDEDLRQIYESIKELRQESESLSAVSESSFTDLEDALTDARRALQNAEIAYETNKRYQAQLIQLKDSLQKTQAELTLLEKSTDGVTREEVETAQAALGREQADLHRLQMQHQKDEGDYKREYVRYEGLNGQLQAALSAQTKLAELQGRAQLCAKLAKYLRTNRDRFTKQVWQALLVSASSFAQLATGGQIQGVSRTDDGAFEYVEEDHKMTVEAASGVQRAILGVGVRLAIAEALRSPVDFLLLDEVTAGATDEVSLSMSRTLAHAQQQVLMVTHRQSDAAVADSMISI